MSHNNSPAISFTAWPALWPLQEWVPFSSLFPARKESVITEIHSQDKSPETGQVNRLTFHNISLDLQLPTHKKVLCFRLATDQLAEVLITQGERHWNKFKIDQFTTRLEQHPGGLVSGPVCLARTKLTVSLLASRRLALADFARLLEIYMPGFFLVLVVLQLEGEDGLALVDGVLSLRLARG